MTTIFCLSRKFIHKKCQWALCLLTVSGDDESESAVYCLCCIDCVHLGKTLTTEDDLDTEDLKDDERRDVMVDDDGDNSVAVVMSCHWCW